MAEGGRNLTIKPFTLDENHIEMEETWEEWLDELEQVMKFFRISDAEDKKDAMLIYCGVEILQLEKSLQIQKEGAIYVKLREKLNNHFSEQKKSTLCKVLVFEDQTACQRDYCGICSVTQEKALECDFLDIDERILVHKIQTTTNAELVRQALHKTMDTATDVGGNATSGKYLQTSKRYG